jgi:hypothetical protein
MAGMDRIMTGRVAWAAFVLLAFAALLPGCGSSYAFSGVWVGRRDLGNPKGVDPAVVNTVAMVHLEVRPNGTFELLEGGMPKSGTWRSDGEKAYLRVTHFMGRPIKDEGELAVRLNEEIVLEAKDASTASFTDPAGFREETIVLRREKTASQPAGGSSRTTNGT